MNTLTSRRCVLVVEDEMLVAMLAEDILVDAGYRVLKAARVRTALQLARDHHTRLDAALLDITLVDGEVYPVAAQLRKRGVPFLFVAGHDVPDLSPDFADCPILHKPYPPETLVYAMTTLVD